MNKKEQKRSRKILKERRKLNKFLNIGEAMGALQRLTNRRNFADKILTKLRIVKRVQPQIHGPIPEQIIFLNPSEWIKYARTDILNTALKSLDRQVR